jgi:monothiol glutaredoxin
LGDNTTAHEPPPIRQLSAPDLKALLKSGTASELVDVRTEEERAIATIDGSRLLDQAYHDALILRDRDAPIVFQCHHGVRNQHAAEYFRREGFRNLYNLRGGIDAWSLLVDTSVPARSHAMLLDSQRVATVSVDGRSVWRGGSRSL